MDRLDLFGARARRVAAVALVSFVLAACGVGDDTSADGGTSVTTPSATSNPTVSPTPASPKTAPADAAPQIGGTPSVQIDVGGAYVFQPTASDPDGDALTFQIENCPAWATFDAATGRLSGQPGPGDVGRYDDVTIQVTANGKRSKLAPFDIDVVAMGPKSVTLSWSPPTQNEDTSPLTDLAGYKIQYGTERGAYTKEIVLMNPGLTSYVVEGLIPATYYFVVRAINAEGIESENSNEASKTI